MAHVALDCEVGRPRGRERVTEVAVVGFDGARSWYPDDALEVLSEVLDALRGYTVVGWCVASDLGTLQRWAHRLGRAWREPQTVDLLLEVRTRWRLSSYSLGAVCQAAGVDVTKYKLHTALDDARLTWDLWLALGQRRRHVQVRRRG